MSTNAWIAMVAALALCLGSAGCNWSYEDDDDAADDDAADDDVADDDVADDDDDIEVDCEDAASLRAEALENGILVGYGVTLEEATPIADILADSAGYSGQVVQIEGFAVALCPNQGCWATLEDFDGNQLNLKVDDGLIDFRDVSDVGVWIIGEGTYDPAGGHGPQVYIPEYGAMIGTVNCFE